MSKEREIHWVFVAQLNVHPITVSIAHELHHEGDAPLTVVASWWIACKFEEMDGDTLTVDDLHHMFPRTVVLHRRAIALRNAEKEVLTRCNFCIPYNTHMRKVYQLLPADDGATKYHEWLLALQEHRVLHRLPAPYVAYLLAVALERTLGLPPALQVVSHLLNREERARLCPRLCPRLEHKKRRRGALIE